MIVILAFCDSARQKELNNDNNKTYAGEHSIFLNPKLKQQDRERHGFNSLKATPILSELENTRKKRVQTSFGRKISNFNQSSLNKRKRFLLSHVNTNHRPLPTSHLKRAARAQNSGVMANQDLN